MLLVLLISLGFGVFFVSVFLATPSGMRKFLRYGSNSCHKLLQRQRRALNLLYHKETPSPGYCEDQR